MIQIIDCVQGEPDWFAARAGLPTASEFATVMAKGKGGAESRTRRTYMLKLAGEILTGAPSESYSNIHMERGKEMEPDARAAYAFMTDAEPQLIGFIRNGQKGCSPDALIGASGLLELKTKAPHLHLECLLAGTFPAEHRAQCQGALWVAEREWIDLAVYWPRLPLFIVRAYRDEAFIAALSDAVDVFNDELAAVVERVRSYGSEPARVAA